MKLSLRRLFHRVTERFITRDAIQLNVKKKTRDRKGTGKGKGKREREAFHVGLLHRHLF